MRSRLMIVALFVLLLSCEKGKNRILVFSKTTGYRHASIPEGKLALMELGKKHGFDVDTTENAALFTEENLKNYNAVVFLNTTQDVLDPVQQGDFKRFIEAGGGYVGIHAAADTEYEWPWYGKLVGAYFKSHPEIQQAKVNKIEAFGTTIPDVWERKDEWYNYKKISADINVILKLDETSYKGGENHGDHPIAWYHEFEGGRAFYTGMGHTKESYSEPLFLEHLLQGIRYAMGDNVKLDYDKVKSKRTPEENRFSKVVLDFNFNEPTEMAILPDGNILFLERAGSVKFYDQQLKKTELITTIPVNTKYNKNEKGEIKEAEDGLLGVALDPDFKSNNWIYLYYSAAGSEPKNVLTRYVFKDKKLDASSMKVILEVPVQRDQCCHTGGSIAFDPQGNLYLSTGDNVSPFESDGFSPSDERPGRHPFDGQGSSGNTNDLRGKILRIRPQPDGTYTIPEGNLFAKGEAGTRPEIFVMGTRNPYRISIDQRTGYLYWGEVGPDAGESDSLRGPRGYDEINQAKKAGFYGWPYFVGDNYAYSRYDFAARKVIAKWDPVKPINESPNNTGKRELPHAQPAFIWYPYAQSEEFPMTKTGSRNAMAGPVYYSKNFKGVSTAFPDYFDGKLMIYDWMRNWIFLVSMDAEDKILDIEPFMASTKFNNIIDMAYGPDGKLYMLEYGTAWFKQNLDARLVRIDYNGGNRPPVANLAADKVNGAAPLTVRFTSTGTVDYDGDAMKYELSAAGKTYSSSDGNFTVTFDKPGVYNPTLKVTDAKGDSHAANVQIIAGNETPKVEARITSGNKNFYFPGAPVQYAVDVTDAEDGSTAAATIPAQAVKITFQYLKGYDMTDIARGHQQALAELPGKSLLDKSDCKSCHLVDQRSAGPSYLEIAQRYQKQDGATDHLAAKIIKGGAGVWGTTEMAAHPQISPEDAKKMVTYILSLGDQKPVQTLPLSGSVKPGNEQDGAYLLTASYADKGGAGGVPSLSNSHTVVLRSPMLSAKEATKLAGPRLFNYQGQYGLENVMHNGSAAFAGIDLTGVKKIAVFAYLDQSHVEGEVSLHLDRPDGKLLGKVNVAGKGVVALTTTIAASDGVHDVYVVFKNERANGKPLFIFGGLKLLNK